jgi:LPXTG-motif cell wall-anchored protein
MTFITVAVISVLCLVFSSTRKYGVVGTGLLLYFQPYYTIGVLALAGGAFYYFRRRKSNAV